MTTTQSIPKVVWEPLGINAKDDFIAAMFGCYTLRVEKMAKNRWWWAVVLHKNQIIRSTYNSDEVASSNDNNESFAKTEKEAKLLAEIGFIRHFINARTEKLNSVSEMIKKVIDDPKFGDDFGKWIIEKRIKTMKKKKIISDKSDVIGSLLAPSLEKRIAFAEDLIEKIDDGKITVSAILAATYWMQAEMINLNKK